MIFWNHLQNVPGFAQENQFFNTIPLKDNQTPTPQYVIDTHEKFIPVDQYYLEDDKQNSIGCGPNALLMLYKFYGLYKNNLSEPWGKDSGDNPGVPPTELVTSLKSMIFAPWTLLPNNFSLSGRPTLPENLIQQMEMDLKKNNFSGYNLKIVQISRVLGPFLSSKGKSPEVLQDPKEVKDKIKTVLNGNRPLVALITYPSCITSSGEAKHILHYVLIVGYRELFFNDNSSALNLYVNSGWGNYHFEPDPKLNTDENLNQYKARYTRMSSATKKKSTGGSVLCEFEKDDLINKIYALFYWDQQPPIKKDMVPKHE